MDDAMESGRGMPEGPPSGPLFERAVPEGAEAPIVRGFEVESLVGRGAMAEVWRARQQGRLARTVALKLLRRDVLDAERLRRFEQEARALAAIDDPRVVRPFEVGLAADGRPYIAMEFIAGAPLAPRGPVAGLDIAERVRLVVALLEAVEALHARGIVHRDLKPGNVLVVSVGDGRESHERGGSVPRPARADIRLIDLGLAKWIDGAGVMRGESSDRGNPIDRDRLTIDGAVIGTPEFMSPEQAGTVVAPITPRSDVFSVGVLLYALVEDAMPWSMPADDPGCSRAAAFQRLLAAMHRDPPRRFVRCDDVLAAIVRKAIRADPADRFGSAGEFREALAAWLRGETAPIESDRRSERGKELGRRARGSPRTAAIALLAAMSVALAVVYAMVDKGQGPRSGGADADWRRTELAWIEDSRGVVVGAPASSGPGEPRLVAGAWRNPRGLDVDRDAGVVYWTDFAGRIERVRLDGSERMAIGGYPKACGIDVAPSGGRSDAQLLATVAWTCYGDERSIWQATEEGTDPTYVTGQVRSPTGLRAMPDGSYLFSDWELNGVYQVRRGGVPERIVFVDGVYGIDERDGWVYYGDRTTQRILATRIADRRTVVLVDDPAVGPVWQVVVSRRGDRVWWTRHQPDRAICTARIALDAAQPSKVEEEFPLGIDPWGLAIVSEP